MCFPWNPSLAVVGMSVAGQLWWVRLYVRWRYGDCWVFSSVAGLEAWAWGCMSHWFAVFFCHKRSPCTEHLLDICFGTVKSWPSVAGTHVWFEWIQLIDHLPLKKKKKSLPSLIPYWYNQRLLICYNLSSVAAAGVWRTVGGDLGAS